MKKVIVVSKTHLDLGFTDYAENIRRKYIDEFIPQAIALADKVNTKTSKSFIWTTGSWIIKEGLEHSTEEQKEKLIKAIKDGNIVAHALPFTVHSELLDSDTFDYGLSIVDSIDAIRGQKTVAAKMTDVPGHTKAIVPLLASHGIKLLHIGVNGVSAVPEVPECFLWKCGESEVVVVYSGAYGGAFKSELIDEVLYFDHTVDNRGAPSPERVKQKLDEIQGEFPDYEVSAGTLDEFAQCIWQVKDKLPVFEGEIGDSWIHGSATDPYKSASLRELTGLKKKWLQDGSMKRDSSEYESFSDALLCIAEHTCGMDSKISLADYENYLKADFCEAKKRDIVERTFTVSEYPYLASRVGGEKKDTQAGSFSYEKIQKSWAEQRLYIDKALNGLSSEHKAEAEKALLKLRPTQPKKLAYDNMRSCTLRVGGYELVINENGGIGRLTLDGNDIIKQNSEPIIEYRSYSHKDYEFWFKHYSRCLEENRSWGYADFGRPLLEYADGKYPVGRFFYAADGISVQKGDGFAKAFVRLKCDEKLCGELGAPREIQIVYTLEKSGLTPDVSWYGKDESRLTEAIFLHMYPNCRDISLVKLGREIDFKTVVSMGGRNLHAVEKAVAKTDFGDIGFKNYHSPLISIGTGKILEYDNKLESVDKDGLSYVLYNNVWGTNFPLWYGENASFGFKIARNENL